MLRSTTGGSVKHLMPVPRVEWPSKLEEFDFYRNRPTFSWFKTRVAVCVRIFREVGFSIIHVAVAEGEIRAFCVPAAYVVIPRIEVAVVRGVWGCFLQEQERAGRGAEGGRGNAGVKAGRRSGAAEQGVDRVAVASMNAIRG